MLRSLRFRLMLVVGLAAVVPLLVLASLWARDLRDHGWAELGQRQADLAEVVGDQVGAMVGDIRRLLETTARLPMVRAGAGKEVEALFARIESGRIAGGQLLAVRPDGAVVAASGAQAASLPSSVAVAPGFRRAVETRSFSVGDPEPEGPVGRGLVDFWVPVTDEAGTVVRLVGLILDARTLGGAWDRLPPSAGGAVVLIGGNGRVVAQGPAGEASFGRNVSATPLWGEMRRRGSGTGEGVLTEDGVRRVYGFRRIPGPSWVLAVGAPPVLAASLGLPPLSSLAAGMLVLFLAGLGGIVWGLAGNVTRGLHMLAAAAGRLAAGDLRTPVEGAGMGQIGAVASSLERIRQQLAERPGGLEEPHPGAGTGQQEPGDRDKTPMGVPASLVSELAILQAVPPGGSRAAGSPPAYEPLLSQLVSHLGMDAGALYHVADSRQLRLLGHVGYNPPALEAMAWLPMGEGIVGRVAQGGDAFVAEDASREARLVRDVVRLEGLHGLAAVPLPGQGRTLGVLEVASRARRKLGGREIDVLRTVSQHLGLALASAALHEDAERRAARLRTLARLAQPMAASLSPQEVLYLAVMAAVQLLEPAYVRMWLWDPATGRPQPGPWYGQADLAEERGPDAAGVARETDAAAARAPEAQIAALAVRAGEPVFMPQVASDPRCPDPRWWMERGVVSLAAVPLSVGERALGVLTVVPVGASTFPEADREILDLLASQSAVALENARLHQERTAEPPADPARQKELLRAEAGPAAGTAQVPGAISAPDVLVALDAAVAATDDVDLALEVIADEVRPIVGADVGAVFRLDRLPADGTMRLLHPAAGGLLVGAGAGLNGSAGVVGAALAARAPRSASAPFGEVGEETLETLALSAGYRAVAAAPVLEGEAPTGVLAVCRRAPEPFEGEALAALAAVAARISAVWTDRARMVHLRGKTEAWPRRP